MKTILLICETSKRSHVKAKDFCLSFVHWGVNKAISHKTTIEMYECGYEGQLAYYEDAKLHLNDTYQAAEIPPVIKGQLNAHNITITRAKKAILDAYRYKDKKSILRKFEKTPYYSLMHDGISKFSHELNRVYMREIDDDCTHFSSPIG